MKMKSTVSREDAILIGNTMCEFHGGELLHFKQDVEGDEVSYFTDAETMFTLFPDFCVISIGDYSIGERDIAEALDGRANTDFFVKEYYRQSEYSSFFKNFLGEEWNG
jgi:hypothetical protein